MAEETQQEVKTKEKTEEEKIDLRRFLSSMRLSTEISEPVPMIQDDLKSVTENVSSEDRFISGMAALLLNIDTTARKAG